MSSLFSGPFFDFAMSQAPLSGADYFNHGSTAMLFQKDGKLYRLTTDGRGHCFLAEQSAEGNAAVVRVIQNYGPVAPLDGSDSEDEFYWLAEVEWLEPVDPERPDGRRLNELLLSLAEDGIVMPEDRAQFVAASAAAAEEHVEFALLLRTAIKAAGCLFPDEGAVDANITNAMRRPVTGEIVWTDPIFEPLGYTTDEQEIEMARIRELVGA